MRILQTVSASHSEGLQRHAETLEGWERGSKLREGHHSSDHDDS